MADRAIGILELLVEGAYSPAKAELLRRANRELEVLRWPIRLARDRGLFTARPFEFTCLSLTEWGRMVGGLAQAVGAEGGVGRRTAIGTSLSGSVPSRTWRRRAGRRCGASEAVCPGTAFLTEEEKELVALRKRRRQPGKHIPGSR